MIRCTIDLLPGGDESKARTVGLIEIALERVTPDGAVGDYRVVLTKTPPFPGALKAAWRQGRVTVGHEDEAIMVGEVLGHPRAGRGVYDLLYRALRGLGLEKRIPRSQTHHPERNQP